MPVKNAVVNYTRRRRLTQDEFIVELDWNSGRYPTLHLFTKETDWETDFPPNSPVCIEFHKRSIFHGVKLGTVADIQLPTDVAKKTLTGFNRNESLSYRVLIYAPGGPTGLLLGRSATIPLSSPHKEPKGSGQAVELLATIKGKLPGGVPSRLTFPETATELVTIEVSDDNPELFDAISEGPEKNPAYYALTMVPYLHTIATRLVFEVKRDPELDLDNTNLWQHRWNDCFIRQYGAKSVEDVDLDDNALIQEWINGIVSWWCKSHSNPNRDIQALVGGV